MASGGNLAPERSVGDAVWASAHIPRRLSEVADAAPGQRVEMFGPNLPIDGVARQAGTVSYELLTRIAARVPRVHLGETPE